MIKFSLSSRKAFFTSVVIHIFLFIAVFITRPIEKPVIDTITVELNSPQTQPKKSALKKVPQLEKQIVENHKDDLNKEAPKNAHFLSEHNLTVQKQTIAKNRGEFKDTKSNRPKLSLSELHPQYDPSAAKAVAKVEPDSGQSNDYIKDVDEGIETLLNSREFKYFTYYNRIRKQLGQFWEPKVKEKVAKLVTKGRRIASNQDHITKLLITLNTQGNLVRVQILGESGVADLDDAALEAFRAAAPFPNPPQGIIESDGTVKIRWDFVLES